MTSADLPLVYEWRNHWDVRRYMYTQHFISTEEHQRWYENASQDPKRHLLLFELNSAPLGFINFHEVALGGIADWGFYLAPNANKGAGRRLAHSAFEYAFNQIKFHKLCGQVLAYNERSIRFHRSIGFLEEGTLRHQYFDGNKYHDVICFGLLCTEWQSLYQEEKDG